MMVTPFSGHDFLRPSWSAQLPPLSAATMITDPGFIRRPYFGPQLWRFAVGNHARGDCDITSGQFAGTWPAALREFRRETEA